MIFTGVDGGNGGMFYVLSSSNPTLPLIQWTIIQTNHFDETGSFAVTNRIDSDQPRQFYRLQVAP